MKRCSTVNSVIIASNVAMYLLYINLTSDAMVVCKEKGKQ